MANKQYTSIIRLFDFASVEIGAGLNISRIKKQLNAEFEISKSGFIEIDGYTYNKDDVFEELSLENFSERLVFHTQIWESKNILQWLEKNMVSLPEVDQEFNKFYNNKDFDNFFSPYFSGPFSYTVRSLINNLQIEELGKLLAYEDFLQPAERVDAFKPIRLFLDENLRLFKNMSDQNYSVMRPKISFWIDQEWQRFMNNLPGEFYEEKTDIVIFLINLTVKIQKWNIEDCKKITSRLLFLNEIPENLKETISNNYTVFYKPKKISYSWIFWGIFILAKIMFMNGCG